MLLFSGTRADAIVEGDRTEPAGTHHPPTWLGAISVLTEGPLGVRMQAETACDLAVIAAEDFRRLAFAHPAVHRRVMRQVAPVMSRITAIEQNRERLAALGQMAAGLAHELNNPAAAAQRAAAQMAEALEVVSGTIGHFVDSGVEREDAAQLVALHDAAVAAAGSRTALDALDAADAEDELTRPPRGARRPRAVAPRRAARRGRRRPRVARPRARARRPGDRRRARLGRRDAHRARPRRRAAGVDRRGCRASSAP